MTVKSAEAGVVSHEAPETNEKKVRESPFPKSVGKSERNRKQDWEIRSDT